MSRGAISVLILLVALSACSDTEDRESKKASATMKCGAGKCGANMFDGNSALIKKKNNILSQMDDKDLRRECVLRAQTTKTLYDCVRDQETGKLRRTDPSVKEVENAVPAKKCGAEKCGGKM